MLQVLHPTYTLKLRIQDRGSFQNFNSAPPTTGYRYYDRAAGKSGCDEVLAAVRDALSKAGVDADVSLDRFQHES